MVALPKLLMMSSTACDRYGYPLMSVYGQCNYGYPLVSIYGHCNWTLVHMRSEWKLLLQCFKW